MIKVRNCSKFNTRYKIHITVWYAKINTSSFGLFFRNLFLRYIWRDRETLSLERAQISLESQLSLTTMHECIQGQEQALNHISFQRNFTKISIGLFMG